MRAALRWMGKRGFHVGDGPFRVERVNGFVFARWLAKTACTIAASAKAHVPEPLASYAFASDDDPAVRVYFAASRGLSLTLDLSHIGTYWIHRGDNPDAVLVCFNFYGMPFVIGSIPIDEASEMVEQILRVRLPRGAPLIDRLRQITVDDTIPDFGPVRRGQIEFDWPRNS